VLLQTVLQIQPKVQPAAGRLSNDEIILQLVDQIEQELPINLSSAGGAKELFELSESQLIPSLSTVLLQEVARFNALLNIIRTSLAELRKAIQGLIVISLELDQTFYELINNQVPRLWEKAAYPSLKRLASWLSDLKERVAFMSKWLERGNPACFWLSGFFFPQGNLKYRWLTVRVRDRNALDLRAEVPDRH